MVLSVLMKFIYPPPPSTVVTVMTAISFLSLSNAGYMETKGKHMKYSKLWSQPEEQPKIPSKKGMFITYAPAFLASLASLFLFSDENFRFTLLRFCVTTHFFKRVLEVLLIHKFSGWMDIEAAITISLSYFLSSTTLIYAQHLTQGLPEPEFDLKYVGILMFLLGICGNLYHHYLLSKLRSDGDQKQYKIPRGGLFDKVICPHYLFEIVGFLGISCISQTLYSCSWTLGLSFYLMGRSYATKKWYESKFEDFPKDVKALVPYIF